MIFGAGVHLHAGAGITEDAETCVVDNGRARKTRPMTNDTTGQAQVDPGGETQGVPPAVLAQWLQSVGAARDEDAFEKLFRYFCPKLFSYMRRGGLNDAAAEELVQDTMTRVWQKAGMYDATLGAPSTWVFAIARNLRIDQLKKCREIAQPLEELPTLLGSTGDTSEIRIDAVNIVGRLKDLSTEQFAVLELVYLDGLSQTEISDRLAVPLGTVKSRIRLGFERLRKALRIEL